MRRGKGEKREGERGREEEEERQKGRGRKEEGEMQREEEEKKWKVEEGENLNEKN